MVKKDEPTIEIEESNVTVHIDKDPNDPRKFPPVDGNTQPKVDINKPQ